MYQSKVPIVVCSKASYQAGEEYLGQFKHSAVWWVVWYYQKLRAWQKQRDFTTIGIMLECMHILVGVSTVIKICIWYFDAKLTGLLHILGGVSCWNQIWIFWCNNNWSVSGALVGELAESARGIVSTWEPLFQHWKPFFSALRVDFDKSLWEHSILKRYLRAPFAKSLLEHLIKWRDRCGTFSPKSLRTFNQMKR